MEFTVEKRKEIAARAEHVHEWTFLRTDADWWDGDEEDVYACPCGARDRRYVPR